MKEEVAAPWAPTWKATLAGLLALTTPWFVVLLLTTTWAGMSLAQGGAPALGTFGLTTVGGALAAGGANAINSYIDRRMNRAAPGAGLRGRSERGAPFSPWAWASPGLPPQSHWELSSCDWRGACGARRVYRFSQVYLALLMLAMVRARLL